MLTTYDRLTDRLSAAAPGVLPTLSRLVFAGVLLFYFWSSALTKLGPGLFGFLCKFDQMSSIFQEGIALMILQSMADFMRRDNRRREGFTVVMSGVQGNNFGFGIIMVPHWRGFHTHLLQTKPIEQMTG